MSRPLAGTTRAKDAALITALDPKRDGTPPGVLVRPFGPVDAQAEDFALVTPQPPGPDRRVGAG